MSSKRITIVLGTILVAFTATVGYKDAVRTWQTLQENEQRIESLNTEYEQLTDELDTTERTQEQSQEEVDTLEQRRQELELKRQELEKKLQSNKGTSIAYSGRTI